MTITDINGPTLKSIIEYCYSGKIQITNENVLEIVEAASAMNLLHIEQKCEQFWSENLTTSNCLNTFLLSDKYSFLELRQKSFEFICEHFGAVASIDVLELEFEHFAEILKSETIYATEPFIFERSMQWIEYEKKKRSKYAPDLMQLIRMEKIPLLV